MSRRNISKKRFKQPDPDFNSHLVNLLVVRLLKAGKTILAQKIINETFDIIKQKTGYEGLNIFEIAIKNTRPLLEVKSRRIGGSTYQVPIEVNEYRSINLALCWVIRYARNRNGRTIQLKLANEIIDASNNIGNAVKKKEETHRMAEANKAFAHFRY